MNNIRIYLAESGAIANLQKDFPLYQGQFNNKLLNIYIPTSILGNTLDTQYIDSTGFVHTEAGTFTAVKIGMTYIKPDGSVSTSIGFYLRYLKTLVYNNVEYALYERKLPSAFTVYAGEDENAPTLITNVVNMQNNNTIDGDDVILGTPTILEIITTQTCKLDVLESTSFDSDEVIDASELEIINGQIDDLYEKYDTLDTNIQDQLDEYTYDKATIDAKDQSIYDAVNAEFYDKTESDALFVHLTGNETIADTKTFSTSPIVPNPSANQHPVTRIYQQTNYYDKTQVNNITQGITFDTYQNFIDWIAGSYSRADGLLPSDMIIGKKVYIIESDTSNYRCLTTPVTSISNFEALAEDIKALQEITANTFDDITGTNGQTVVEQINDKVNLKNQVIEQADLTITTASWVDNTTNYYYDYYNANFTNPTKQRFDFISNSVSQNETLKTDQFIILGLETLNNGTSDYVRIYANKVPSTDITLKVLLETYTDSNIQAGDILASAVEYNNVSSYLIATNVQSAIDELNTNIGTNTTNIGNLENGTTNITYDNIISGLTATTVKGAIDENASDIVTNAGNISTNTSDIGTNAGNISTNTSDISDILDGTQNADTATNAEKGISNVDGSFETIGKATNATTDVLKIGTNIIEQKQLLFSGEKTTTLGTDSLEVIVDFLASTYGFEFENDKVYEIHGKIDSGFGAYTPFVLKSISSTGHYIGNLFMPPVRLDDTPAVSLPQLVIIGFYLYSGTTNRIKMELRARDAIIDDTSTYLFYASVAMTITKIYKIID